MQFEKKIVIVALLLIAIVLVGEIAVYGVSDRYSSDASVDGDDLNYSISAQGSKNYSVLVTGGVEKMDELYIYYDTSYGNLYTEPTVAVGARPLTLEYYIQQLIAILEFRGITNITKVTAQELKENIVTDVSSGSNSNGLVVLSGVLPDTIYTGDPGDKIFEWMDDGGRLYWAGNILGKHIGKADGSTEEVLSNYQELFFGKECLNMGEADRALSAVDNEYLSALSLLNNNVKYAVNTSALDSISQEYVEMGYAQDGYSSIVLVKHGSGSVCVLGGDYSNNQRADMAQVIASNIGHASVLIESAEGVVKRNISSTINLDIASGDVSVYISLGGAYLVYGRCYFFNL